MENPAGPDPHPQTPPPDESAGFAPGHPIVPPKGIYPQATKPAFGADQAPPPQSKPTQHKHVTRNPFTNMYSGFIKFAKTNLLLAIVYVVVFIAVATGGSLAVGAIFAHSEFNSTRQQIPFVLAGVAVLVLAYSSLALLLANLLVNSMRGRRLKIRQSLAPLRRVWVVFAWAASFMVIYLALVIGMIAILLTGTGSATLNNGLSLLIIPVLFIVGIILMCRWAFAMFVVADEPHSGPLSALKRSAQLTAGYRWTIFVYFLLFGIIGAVLDKANVSINVSRVGSFDVSTPRTIILGVLSAVIYTSMYCAFAELYEQVKDGQDPPPAAHRTAR